MENKEKSFCIGEAYIAYKKMTEPTVQITQSAIAKDFAHKVWYDDIDLIERFLILNLNRYNMVVSWHWISQGGRSGTVVDQVVIAKSAIDILACGVICVHNHPSGNINPSESDKALTQKVFNSLNLLDIKLFDHLIIASDKEKYFSFADEGLICS